MHRESSLMTMFIRDFIDSPARPDAVAQARPPIAGLDAAQSKAGAVT
jgi:hypothetical protein